MFKSEAKKALFIGGLCSLSYFSVYVGRNLLSVATPQLLENGVFSQETIGSLSSVFFIVYAAGQLINGVIGDKINPKIMISFGLILAGVCSLLFPLSAQSAVAAVFVYALSGFCLSMIYGPMTKLVAENTTPDHAARCCVAFTFASFFGSPVAGLLAAFLMWKALFYIGSVSMLVMGAVCFILFHLWERKGAIRYGAVEKKAKAGGVRLLLKREIIRYTLVSLLTGVTRTSVVFWLPTYLVQHLGYSSESASLLFTVATLIISASAFFSVFLYERLGKKQTLSLFVCFLASALCFLAMFWVKAPVWNLLLMIAAIFTSNAASSVMWSIYCPSLCDTGMVSGATGYLDFCSYIAAAISSQLFANGVEVIGWSGLILSWFALMAAGVVVSLPFKFFRKSA